MLSRAVLWAGEDESAVPILRHHPVLVYRRDWHKPEIGT